MAKYYLDWHEVEDTWSGNDYIWIDVAILIEDTVGAIAGGDFTLHLDEMDPWQSMQDKLRKKKVEEEKIKKLLKVIVSVKGEEKKYQKELGNDSYPIITISDIQKVLKKYDKGHIKVVAEIKEK